MLNMLYDISFIKNTKLKQM